VAFFPQFYPPKPSSPPYLLHALPTSVFLIWSPEKYLVRNTDHKALRYVFFYIPVLPLPFNILLSTLFSKTLSLRSSLNVSDQVSHPCKRKTINLISISVQTYTTVPNLLQTFRTTGNVLSTQLLVPSMGPCSSCIRCTRLTSYSRACRRLCSQAGRWG
jgi:hypothetical protein